MMIWEISCQGILGIHQHIDYTKLSHWHFHHGGKYSVIVQEEEDEAEEKKTKGRRMMIIMPSYRGYDGFRYVILAR